MFLRISKQFLSGAFAEVLEELLKPSLVTLTGKVDGLSNQLNFF
jgi:hypothetical protein